MRNSENLCGHSLCANLPLRPANGIIRMSRIEVTFMSDSFSGYREFSLLNEDRLTRPVIERWEDVHTQAVRILTACDL